ncbi:MAG: methionine biosynthesis protein MetW [Planctomycetes bacterium]|nr:methionine biosynthesis protein MetW [Planctomycetota bacterium]
MKDRQKTLNLAAMQQLAGLLLNKVDPGLIGIGAEQVREFLARVGITAPAEVVPDGKPLYRWQDKIIEQEIPVGSSVLDLGCGDGELLARLSDMKRVKGQGLEMDSECVMKCVERGVPVLQIDIESGLKGFPDYCFDYVVLEETLQTLQNPEEVLKGMLRVSRCCIVSFPNFGYWRVRLDLAVRGRMPVTEWLPHRWFNTPNIHLLTLQDFLDWTFANSVRIVEGYARVDGQVRELKPEDNIYAEEALFVLEKEGESHAQDL